MSALYDFMAASESWADWYARCSQVKAEHGGGYPRGWHDKVLARGLPYRSPRIVPNCGDVCRCCGGYGPPECAECRAWGDVVELTAFAEFVGSQEPGIDSVGALAKPGTPVVFDSPDGARAVVRKARPGERPHGHVINGYDTVEMDV